MLKDAEGGASCQVARKELQHTEPRKQQPAGDKTVETEKESLTEHDENQNESELDKT